MKFQTMLLIIAAVLVAGIVSLGLFAIAGDKLFTTGKVCSSVSAAPNTPVVCE